jgi:hypothetical protein
MIDEYLLELERRLTGPSRRRRRIVAEVRAHLEDAASAAVRAGKEPAAAEAEAVARFGSARDVAGGFRPLLLCAQLTRAALALALGLAVAAPVVYLVTENLLPPATWAADSPPADLAWQRNLAALGLMAGIVCAGAAGLLGALGRLRAALATALAALAALLLGAASWFTLALGWSERVPGAGEAFAVSSLIVALLLAPAAVAAALLARDARGASAAG